MDNQNIPRFMEYPMIISSRKIISLDRERERRKFINLANADENYIQTKASFALSGIDLTDDDAEFAGRIIAGDITYRQALEELRQSYQESASTPHDDDIS